MPSGIENLEMLEPGEVGRIQRNEAGPLPGQGIEDQDGAPLALRVNLLGNGGEGGVQQFSAIVLDVAIIRRGIAIDFGNRGTINVVVNLPEEHLLPQFLKAVPGDKAGRIGRRAGRTFSAFISSTSHRRLSRFTCESVVKVPRWVLT